MISMKEDIIEAIRKCETTFLPQYNKVVKASLTPYQDNKEDEEGIPSTWRFLTVKTILGI